MNHCYVHLISITFSPSTPLWLLRSDRSWKFFSSLVCLWRLQQAMTIVPFQQDYPSNDSHCSRMYITISMNSITLQKSGVRRERRSSPSLMHLIVGCFVFCSKSRFHIFFVVITLRRHLYWITPTSTVISIDSKKASLLCWSRHFLTVNWVKFVTLSRKELCVTLMRVPPRVFPFQAQTRWKGSHERLHYNQATVRIDSLLYDMLL
jgi:hypothetical protein